MPIFCRRLALPLIALLAALAAPDRALAAQDFVREGFARAAELARRWEGLVSGGISEPQWITPDHAWYVQDLGEGKRKWWQVDAADGTCAPLFDHAAAAKALSTKLARAVEAAKLPIRSLAVAETGASVDDCTFVILVEGLAEPLVLARRGDIRAADGNQAANLQGVLLPGRARSRGQGASIHLTFMNRADRAVELRWIDAGGTERSYATIAPGATYRQQTYAGHAWLVVDGAGVTFGHVIAAEATPVVIIGPEPATSTTPAPPPPPSPGASPDGTMTASIERDNLVVKSMDGAVVFRTDDGRANDGFDGPLLWSPDGTKLVAMRHVRTEPRSIAIVESSPRDQVQPRLRQFAYPKPGDPIDTEKPRLFDVANRRAVPIDDSLFATPWSLDHLHWARDSSTFHFLYNQRGHQVMRVIAVDATTGAARAIVNEECKTFFDYAGKLFLTYIDDRSELLWMSERDGWNHLYLVDATTGDVKRQVTRGDWVVRSVDSFDEAAREVVLKVGGIHSTQDPYHVHFVRISLDTNAMTRLTEGDGTHRITWSPDRRYIVDTWSRVDQPRVTELRNATDGSLVCELAREDGAALVGAGWRAPERFVAKGRDGTTDIWGVIWRPTDFDPARRYPVIEDIYAGPQDSFVPKAFAPWHRQRELAELGFIVVQIDGMGTSNRSKAFHDVAWKNLKDAGFPDRVLWLKAAAAAHPEMDLSRVGIYGGSAGGQNALRGILDHPEMYKACVADCGCHDNRMDKIWWNELWMGWPLDDSYARSSNVVDAHKLEGELLLVVGELDQNVDPASTMQVVDALIKADKDFELLVIPGAGHGCAETPYGKRRRAAFFARTLQ